MVRSFAADDATVVVGTAIDESLEGELRVTVVATGLGHQQQAQQLRSVQQTVQQRPIAGGSGSSYTSHNGLTTGGMGTGSQSGAQSPYANYEKPTVIRKTARGASQGTGPANNGHDVEYLDIPAFLRRQAD